ncbi:VWA domain-containing protein [Streptomyces montanisoli]|uniref:VWA domain-containing protein n=1 Tax=Streptomyces montanisoli TaxID=2798581 RepID=A0A940MHB6_9ACTN|nr:VWA domain-containing protein [Streptomyces montanisoli]MBP0460055.1 VWA domain-containing protein [Streptomyces montanisoli]
MIISKRSAGAACALLAALTIGFLTPGAASADDGPGTAADTPTAKVDLVLDVSGSMSTRDIDGQTRMTAAKQAFDQVIDTVPSGVDLGIRTLGATYPGKSLKIGCKDTKQLYPVGPLDREEAKTAVGTLEPTGWTPIGPALLAAAKDLSGGDGSRRIVLISDGEDTCSPPDPCDVAREIAAKGVHLTVDTLGLVPDAKTQAQLSCIAEATGGTYTSVKHRAELSGRVGQLVHRAASATSTPVATNGTGDCSTAPELKPGLYSDREEFAQHRWYRVDVPAGQELRASVSVADDRPVNPDYGVLLRAVTVHGREIVRGQQEGSGRTDVISAGLRYPHPDTGTNSDGDTAPAETVCLEVSNSYSAPASSKTTPGLPVELAVNLVDAPHDASDAAAFGLGRGWWLLGTLIVVGFAAGIVWGWVSRWRVAIWRSN